MIVKERERVGFNFKGLLKAFMQGNAVNEDDIEKQLEGIKKQEDTKKIDWLIMQTNSTKTTKSSKTGKQRKRGTIAERVEVKSVDYHAKPIEKSENKEIGE